MTQYDVRYRYFKPAALATQRVGAWRSDDPDSRSMFLSRISFLDSCSGAAEIAALPPTLPAAIEMVEMGHLQGSAGRQILKRFGTYAINRNNVGMLARRRKCCSHGRVIAGGLRLVQVYCSSPCSMAVRRATASCLEKAQRHPRDGRAYAGTNALSGIRGCYGQRCSST